MIRYYHHFLAWDEKSSLIWSHWVDLGGDIDYDDPPEVWTEWEAKQPEPPAGWPPLESRHVENPEPIRAALAYLVCAAHPAVDYREEWRP